jgi:hypothetical protein
VGSGYDVKLNGQAPYLPWAKIKGTYYYWDTKAGPDIKGFAGNGKVGEFLFVAQW